MQTSETLAYEKVTYERSGFREDMLIQPISQTVDFELKMISLHPEIGLLKVCQEGEKLAYEIQGMKSFSHLFVEHQADYMLIWKLLYGIVMILKGLEEYLLREDSVLLEPDKVYLDVKQSTVKLCYVSGYSGNIRQQLCTLVEYIMRYMDHRNDKLVVLVYGIYHIIREEQYSLASVEQLLKEKSAACIETEEGGSEQKQEEQKAKECFMGQEKQEEKKDEEKRRKNRREEIKEYICNTQVGRRRRLRILFGTVAGLFLIGTVYFYQNIFVLRLTENYNLLYGCLVGLMAGCGGALWQQWKLFQLQKVLGIHKEIQKENRI